MAEPVERKADDEAEGEPGRRRPDHAAEPDPEEPAPDSATGHLLTDMGLPAWATVARLSLAVLLFGGLILAFTGAGLWVEERFGTYATMVVAGLAAVVLSYLLAQVYSYRGWI